ncbi:S8 family serine peptidase [Cognatishimia sp. F0-27]|uniref:S8 family serine peptidase n=1 Tax=Cognatishimia sp. F0-27 TaxID=2816855 RepID=UPI001D0CCD77|nr:S8 family serine peptidase [Cognatishimia sp. F0-27]MCC1493815.1 S8 family serine peptidase [Cognatishimia sp. F0-27]
MSLTWNDPAPGPFEDAYLDWAARLDARRHRPTRGPLYEPVFVRLVATEPPEDAREALLHALEDPEAPLIMDRHESALLKARIENDPFVGLPDEYTLYRRLDAAENADADPLFTILDRGVPVEIVQGETRGGESAPFTAGTGSGAPIVAVIDDGIAHLNARFRDGDGQTRFHAVWLQAQESTGDGNGVLAGEVLSRETINAHLAAAEKTGGEADVYGALNARLFPHTGRRATDFSDSHGTHVLDLAAGANPGDPAADWPLMAVSLPPDSIDDTSGTRCESYIVMGMRWILHEARRLDACAPVIVNISLGILAGPKNGGRFVEYQVAREAALWEEITGQPVRVVWSFGNNHRDALMADLGFSGNDAGGEAQTLTWRVQPGDKTANYMEIHPRKASSDRFALNVTTPCGTASGFVAIPVGASRQLISAGAPVAEIFHVPPRDFGHGHGTPAHYVIALAPSEARDGFEPLAPAGAWHIAVQDCAGGPQAAVSLQIQRDDAPRGYRGETRQSYFDASDAYAWDPEVMAYLGLSEDGAITHAGAHNAMASVIAPQVFTAGAAMRSPVCATQDAGNYRPARYTAQGSIWSVPGPTVSMVAEDGAFLSGVGGTGTQTGTCRFYSGTSAAAGRLSRALALSADGLAAIGTGTGAANLAVPGSGAITLIPVAAEHRARLGAYIVEVPETTPARRL